MSDRTLLIAGAALAGVALLGTLLAPIAAMHAWLAATALWAGLPAGALGLLAITRLVPGRWAHALSPILEATALTLPLAAVAAVPVLAAQAWLYPWWAHPGLWLAPVPFVGRTILWFGGLGAFGWALLARRGSAAALSIGGLVFLTLWGSVVAVDWVLSLDAAYGSSSFGLQLLIVWFTLALSAAAAAALTHDPGHAEVLAPILLTAALLWCYLQFMPFLTDWSGNHPAAAGWYLRRASGAWGWLIGAALAIHIAAAAALAARTVRRSGGAVRLVAGALVLAEAMMTGWLVLPQAGPAGGALAALLYPLAAIGLGLLFAGAARHLLARRIAERTA